MLVILRVRFHAICEENCAMECDLGLAYVAFPTVKDLTNLGSCFHQLE